MKSIGRLTSSSQTKIAVEVLRVLWKLAPGNLSKSKFGLVPPLVPRSLLWTRTTKRKSMCPRARSSTPEETTRMSAQLASKSTRIVLQDPWVSSSRRNPMQDGFLARTTLLFSNISKSLTKVQAGCITFPNPNSPLFLFPFCCLRLAVDCCKCCDRLSKKGVARKQTCNAPHPERRRTGPALLHTRINVLLLIVTYFRLQQTWNSWLIREHWTVRRMLEYWTVRRMPEYWT